MDINTDAMKAQNKIKEKKEWEGDYYYAEINEINIPIPGFVQLSTIKEIFAALQEAQNQVNDYLENPKLKNQILVKNLKN
ncbi:hypothetical protein TTHERM_000378449 (macronuclear) [Tetrahymena thermophila SB210]|uniref:Uncharacterized protein n=1 Tax=Tetrahymena thermophila (strain SB210) TaxID=312017 RepID=W7XAV7_TETTS|nr:hypothetical protein TTHERM_000378449 [Tetrahymena thermophila SB210]EWS74482.1 hypothetical protein TTHERM_000378449 [Tetrahymena thermophila SB210]|eukprot:XP_012652967.1 hypothetical protein TTHERM_000378449 [Tetrahymena thermophila SB210]